MVRRGVVWICPSDSCVPPGRMVDPGTSAFSASWQDEGPLGGVEVTGAEAAIAWGHERAERILIRLGHNGVTYFSAGSEKVTDFPVWPPAGPPPAGWWSPSEAGIDEESPSGLWSVRLGLKLQGDRELGEAAKRAFMARIAEDPGIPSVTGTEEPARGEIQVTAIVLARTRGEAEGRSGQILGAASSAAAAETSDWSTTAWWSSVEVDRPGVGQRQPGGRAWR
jgi:hypothetical protein